VQAHMENRAQDVRTVVPPKAHDDGAFVGQGVISPLYAERPSRSNSHSFSNSSGQGYQRPDLPAPMPEQQMVYPQGRPDRGPGGSRGGYRGRGGQYNSHHQHVPPHGNPMANHMFAQQYPSQNQQYRYGRGNSRMHHNAGRNFPPVYPQHPYPPQYVMPNIPMYDYSAIPNPEESKDTPPKDIFEDLTQQIVKQV